jgi:hypothetical protein
MTARTKTDVELIRDAIREGFGWSIFEDPGTLKTAALIRDRMVEAGWVPPEVVAALILKYGAERGELGGPVVRQVELHDHDVHELAYRDGIILESFRQLDPNGFLLRVVRP